MTVFFSQFHVDFQFVLGFLWISSMSFLFSHLSFFIESETCDSAASRVCTSLL
jgi:hypothetical protein